MNTQQMTDIRSDDLRYMKYGHSASKGMLDMTGNAKM